jgi:Ferritin-like domain
MHLRPTRRELVVAAVAGTGLIPAAAAAETPPPSDAELLGKSLDVERLMVLAYRRVFAAQKLTPAIERVLTPHLAHEVSHVAVLAGRLAALGAPAPTGPLDSKTAAHVMAAHHVPGSLSDLKSQNDCLKLLVDLESAAEGAHYTALKDLRSARLQHLSAQIMACEAQHWTVVSGLRNPGQYVKAVPWPFVFGTK